MLRMNSAAAAAAYSRDVNLQDVRPIMKVTAAANAILPMSPVAANTPICLLRLLCCEAFATAEKSRGWNMPNAMLAIMNARTTVMTPEDKPRMKKAEAVEQNSYAEESQCPEF